MEGPSGRLSFYQLRELDTLAMRINRGEIRYGVVENKNPHAVALGEMTSPAKKASSQKNGEKGGRPKGS